MISLPDAVILATTKLHTRKVRTIITVIIAGLMFGVIMAITLITAGLETSLAKLSHGSIGERYIVAVHPFNTPDDLSTDYDNLSTNVEFIEKVYKAHEDLIAKKTSKANQLGITYSPAYEDPNPVKINTTTGKKTIEVEDIWVSSIAQKISKDYIETQELDIDKYTKGFSTKPAPFTGMIRPEFGVISRMINGKENILSSDIESKLKNVDTSFGPEQTVADGVSISVADDSLVMPLATKKVDPSNLDSIPIIIPYRDAETALGLKPLPPGASSSERINRIKLVREKAINLKLYTCYRNEASSALLGEAISQSRDIEKNKNNKNYEKPKVIYNLPSPESCGPVTIKSDARSDEDKSFDRKMEEFRTTFEDSAKPVQIKQTYQVIGVSPSSPEMSDKFSIASLIELLFTSYETESWQIPASYFVKLPQNLRPADIVGASAAKATEPNQLPDSIGDSNDYYSMSDKRVEFTSYDEAMRFKKKYECSWTCDENSLFITPLTSSFIAKNIQKNSQGFIKWMLITLGVIATIIMTAMIGRVVSDSRRETAVFRSIGAKRLDITLIYLTYTFLLALIILGFVVALGLSVALITNAQLADQVTMSALIAFGTQDLTQTVSFISFNTIYALILPVVVIVVALASAVLPLSLNVRRNPIHDMRQE